MSQDNEDKPITQFCDQDLLNLSVRELNRHLRGLAPEVFKLINICISFKCM